MKENGKNLFSVELVQRRFKWSMRQTRLSQNLNDLIKSELLLKPELMDRIPRTQILQIRSEDRKNHRQKTPRLRLCFQKVCSRQMRSAKFHTNQQEFRRLGNGRLRRTRNYILQ